MSLRGPIIAPRWSQDWLPPPTGSPNWILLFGGTPPVPHNQFDWPNPTGPLFPIQLRTWTYSYNLSLIGKDVLPFRQQDWPLPGRPDEFAQWRTWVWWYNLSLIGKDRLPFRQQDWPLPGAPPRIIADAQRNLTLFLASGTVQRPFNQYDWPVPAGYPYPVSLRASFGQFLPGSASQLHDSPLVSGWFGKLMGH